MRNVVVNINPEYDIGKRTFETVEELEAYIISFGYALPEQGLLEDLDFEEILVFDVH